MNAPAPKLANPIFATDRSLIAVEIDGLQRGFKPNGISCSIEILDMSVGVKAEFDQNSNIAKSEPLVLGSFTFKKLVVLPFTEPDHKWEKPLDGGNIDIRPGNTNNFTLTARDTGLLLKGTMTQKDFDTCFVPGAERNQAAINFAFQVWDEQARPDSAKGDYVLLQLDLPVPVQLLELFAGN